MMYQGAIAKFDPKAEKFQYWSLPPEVNKDMTAAMEAETDQARIPELLLERVCVVFGCPRGAVVLVAGNEVTLAASRGVQPLQARMTDEVDLLMQRAWRTLQR